MRRYHKDLDLGIRLGLAAIGMLWGVTQSSGALAAAADQTPQAGLVLGVFPHVAAAQIENLYAPMVADLGLSLGRPIQLKTKTSFEGFVSELEGE
ncbi:MAG: phosphate/phosphite/phosphonate ABC transporter substrate-binding protein, partial [Gammaproteobacteria bacterium]|nr:phosphate/phosphite/phosphonate ABC transporter substrate-binding protein [Gammaproteobacteria bacterium]